MEEGLFTQVAQNSVYLAILLLFGVAVIRHLAKRDERHEQRLDKMNETHRQDIKEITERFTDSIDGVKSALESLSTDVNNLKARK
jgi:uncharacterized membrane protein YhiD involved in acid resistance